ncbi:glycosyltransferase [Polaromonas sp.]|uniref:O-linked N-acetylglucosamine transferase, SPINDLY family protein n=1 Tax=Polaromonas sp. TaxID=1869339 RepID=UPI0035657796
MTSLAHDLQLASRHAQAARFAEMLAICRQLADAHAGSVPALLDVGVLLSNFGFMGRARECYERALTLAPDDLRARVNLANLARDTGDAAECRRLYAALQQQWPDHPVLRRNALVSLEYDPQASDAERLAQARAWGAWAMGRAGGPRARPALRPLPGRALRVGYVSADFCQHTVGLFFRAVAQAHDAARVLPFVYSAGSVHDGVTAAIRAACQFRDVAALDDTAVAALIVQDQIDVLVDLSGHTAGSRLTLFAQRPAPVLVSWLGYFASTGLDCMDAVLLDNWHAPAGAEALFAEPVLRLPGGKFCYQSESFAPANVAPPPCLARGYITFGSFNNSAKYNAGVFDLWARVLDAVPDARLLLKWRSFNDPEFCASVLQAFAGRGMDPQRIELRPPSFHADLLKEYADIDIALDPFPFTGGLTSCEALWMGVPVITWPQSRAVSRQTFAFLSAIGLPKLVAGDADDYLRIAVELAGDSDRLVRLRGSLRARMLASPLMDVSGFTRQLEDSLSGVYQSVYQQAGLAPGRPGSR